MSWLNDLYLTYEACKSEAGVIKEGQPLLLPVAHLTQNAQLEVVLDGEGHFSRAYRVDKEDAVTVIPVTENSGTRAGSAIYPHPLADKLEYIAGDYGEFVAGNKAEKFVSYIAQLEAWAQSAYSLPQILIVYQYLREGMLMHDLLDAGIFFWEGGKIIAEKQQGIALEDWFVRFAVEIPGQPESRLYRDPQVFESYIQFYLSSQENKELCYATGERVPCSEKHPAKIRNTADKAKLISSNNASGVLTFKGRFSDSSQVASVSYEISQKAHSALRWLIAKQACIRAGEQVVVVWSTENPEMASPFEGLFWKDEQQAFTDENYSAWVREAIWGPGKVPRENEHVMVMAVEAATTGRLSIPFYQKYGAKQFLENITKWKAGVCWLNRPGKEQAPVPWSPSLMEIVKLLVGDKNEKVNKSVRERLLPCVVEGRKLPRDIVRSALQQAVNPAHYKDYWEWHRAVAMACALLRKSQIEKEDGKEDQAMGLNAESTDRSYIFGQLLATAEMLERSALTMGGNKEAVRNTAAEKYFVRFQRYPVETWLTIRDQLNPYMMKLKNTGKPFYINRINELTDRLDLTVKDKLEPTFLQGYSSQIMEYRNYSKKTEPDVNED